jgi:hypothetical protein
MVKLAKSLKDRSDFAVLSIATDDESTVAGVRKAIKDFGIKFPVLWFGPTNAPWGTHDWDVSAVPTCFLIDPQGNILFEPWVSEDFGGTMSFLLTSPPVAPYGMEWTHEKREDDSFHLMLHVTSPTHKPLEVTVNIGKQVREYMEQKNGEWVNVDPIPEGKEPNFTGYYDLEGFKDLRQTVTFGEFGDAVLTFDVPPVSNCFLLSFYASAMLPGTEAANGGEGIRVGTGGDIWLEEN